MIFINKNIVYFQLTNETDKKVRDIFTNLIKKFAYLNHDGRGEKNKEVFDEYKSDGNNFIRIAQEASVKQDFRFVHFQFSSTMQI